MRKIILLMLCLLPTLAVAQAPAPVVFFTDLTSGPNTGGENNNGTILTIYGRNFGTVRGTSTVTVGGGAVASYLQWGGRSKAATSFAQLETISVAIGAAATTGTVVVTTNNGPSTCDNSQDTCQFTVRSGNIRCVSTSGSNANNGTFPSSCWATIPFARGSLAPGDIAYVENGISQTTVDNFNAAVAVTGNSCTSANPCAMVVYPGATATVGTPTMTYGIRTPAVAGSKGNWVFAGFNFAGGAAMDLLQVDGWRVINNDFNCPNGGGQSACMHTDTTTNYFFYGNYTHNVGDQLGSIDKFYHGNYYTTNSNHIWMGWNEVNNNPSGSTTSGGCRAVQFFSTGGANQFDLHVFSNYLHNAICDGINFSTVNPSQGTVEAFNNVIAHVGTGPDPANGSSNYSCVVSGGGGTGNTLVYNNTLYDCGSRKTNDAGAFDPTTPGIVATNNTVYQLAGESYVNPNGNASILSGSNNVWFGLPTPPSQTTANITSDPKFVANGTDFTLQSTSPAINAGITNSLAWDYVGVARPQGTAYDIGAYEFATFPTFIYSNAAPLAIPSGSSWNSSVTPACTTSSYCYRFHLDPNVITAGSTLVLSFSYDSTGGNQVFAVTDDKGDTWTLDITSSSSNSRAMRMYHAANVTAGVNYINIQQTGGTQVRYWQPVVTEFYNIGAVDGSSCSAATSATVSAGSITPTQTGDLILQSKVTTNTLSGTAPFNLPIQVSNFTPGSQANIAWNLGAQLLSDGAADQYGVYNATSALNPTFTQAASDSYISCAVAFKQTVSGSAPSGLRVVHQEHDAMPHNAANPWKIGMIANTPGAAVYIASTENDVIHSTGGVLDGVSSVPAPDVGWTASGPDFAGSNGHNHVSTWCAKFNSSPGPIVISVNRTATSNDGIFMVYEVAGGSCNIDVDGGQQSIKNDGSSTSTVCANCLTPTKQNDFILSYGGEAFCTGSDITSPTNGVWDAVWFTGNTIDGPTQTDENNYWSHFFNGANLSPLTVTYTLQCANPTGNWANRITAYQAAPASGNPTVSLSPLTLNFGNQTVNTTSAAQSVTLTNTGLATLTIASVSLTGTNLGDFAISGNTCGASLAPSNSCAVSVTFHPTALASRSANLAFTTNASSSPDNAALTGTGAAAGSPAANFTPASLAFGPVKVPQSAGPTPAILKNTGSAVMNISSISVVGANASEFNQTNTCLATLAVNATCTINVTFAPISAGNKTANVSVVSNTGTSPDAVPLTGTGTTPVVSLSSANVNFFNQFISTTSLTQVVVMTNTGTASLVISSVLTAGDFAQANNCGASLGAGSSCNISITFTPTILGPRSGSVTITDDAVGSPHLISLAGTGVKQISGIGTVSGTGIFKLP